MLLSSPQQSIASPNIKTTSEMVKETLEMLGIDFSDFDMCTTHKNYNDGSTTATTSL